jgi:hypothetical protein
MLAFFVQGAWWVWAVMFGVIPILLGILVLALWMVLSGLVGIIFPSGTSDGRGIPDIMAFLKERYTRKPRTLLYDDVRRPLIRR